VKIVNKRLIWLTDENCWIFCHTIKAFLDQDVTRERGKAVPYPLNGA